MAQHVQLPEHIDVGATYLTDDPFRQDDGTFLAAQVSCGGCDETWTVDGDNERYLDEAIGRIAEEHRWCVAHNERAAS